jgi:hypothetical protein
MTTEALAVPFARRGRRRRMMPGLVPILVGTLVWVAWVVVTEPFAVIRMALRQGAAASYETVFVAMVSVIGLVGIAIYAVAVTAYVLAMRSLRRAP